MKRLVHNRRFQGIISFPKNSIVFYYYKTEIFQKISHKIAMVGRNKEVFAVAKYETDLFLSLPPIPTNNTNSHSI